MSRLIGAALAVLCLWSGQPAAHAEYRLKAVSEGAFSRPHDIVLSPNSEVIFVADLGNNSIKVLNARDLKIVSAIAGSELSSPHDVAVDADGNLLVADTGNGRIMRYEPSDGGAVGSALSGGLQAPEGVVDLGDGRIVVADARAGALAIFENGTLSSTSSKPATDTVSYRKPHDVDFDGENRIAVVDSGNDRIVILAADLTLIRILEGPGFNFNDPKYIAFGDDGALFVADEFNHQIKIFDRNYNLIDTIGSGEQGSADGQLNKPEGVEAKGDLVWVADTHNHRILLFEKVR